MYFKRSFTITLILIMSMILMAGLTACGSNEKPVDNVAKPDTPTQEGPAAAAPVDLDFPTFSMGSTWYAYGATIAETMKDGLPKGSRVNMLDRAGGIGNPKMIGDGQAPIALGYPTSAKWAYEGTEPYTDKTRDGIRSVLGGLDEYYFAIVASKKSGITDLAKMKEEKPKIHLMTVPVGGLGELMTRFTLNSYGITYDDIKAWGGSVEHTDFNAIVDAFRDGKADMFMQTVSQGHPAVTELAITTPVTFVSISEENIEKLNDEYGFFRAEIPAGCFKGQDNPVPTLGLSTNIITNIDVPEETIYAITKSLIEGAERLQKGHKSLEYFDPEKAALPERLGVPLHPGAERYYKEIGLIK